MTKARTLADNFAADINGITAGTGITGGGTSGTVTITNSMATAIDAKGDLVVGTGADTFSRLAVASTAGYLLSVDSAEATGLKWAAPSTGALTKIAVTTFSGVTTANIDSLSATYDTYFVTIEDCYSTTGTGDLQMRFRYGSTTPTNEFYFTNCQGFFNGTASNVIAQGGATLITLSTNIGETPSNGSYSFLWFSRRGANEMVVTGQTVSQQGLGSFNTWAGRNDGSTYTGFQLLVSAGNMSGKVTVYGLEN